MVSAAAPLAVLVRQRDRPLSPPPASRRDRAPLSRRRPHSVGSRTREAWEEWTQDSAAPRARGDPERAAARAAGERSALWWGGHGHCIRREARALDGCSPRGRTAAPREGTPGAPPPRCPGSSDGERLVDEQGGARAALGAPGAGPGRAGARSRAARGRYTAIAGDTRCRAQQAVASGLPRWAGRRPRRTARKSVVAEALRRVPRRR